MFALAAPLMVLLDVIPAVQSVLGWTGIGLMAAGLILVLAAQSGMGASWPVRVDEKSAYARHRLPLLHAPAAASRSWGVGPFRETIGERMT